MKDSFPGRKCSRERFFSFEKNIRSGNAEETAEESIKIEEKEMEKGENEEREFKNSN